MNKLMDRAARLAATEDDEKVGAGGNDWSWPPGIFCELDGYIDWAGVNLRRLQKTNYEWSPAILGTSSVSECFAHSLAVVDYLYGRMAHFQRCAVVYKEQVKDLEAQIEELEKTEANELNSGKWTDPDVSFKMRYASERSVDHER